MSSSKRHAVARASSGLGWCAACAVIGILVAAIAFSLQQQGFVPTFFFPILYPLVVGSLLGAGCALASKLLGVRARYAMLGTVAAVFLSLAAQEYFAFLSYQQSYAEMQAGNPRLELLRAVQPVAAPTRFDAFVRARFHRDPIGLTLDAALTLLAAVFMTLAATVPTRAAANMTHVAPAEPESPGAAQPAPRGAP